MKYPEEGVQFTFSAEYAQSLKSWRATDKVAIMRTESNHTVVLTHGTRSGKLNLGDGTTVAPPEFIRRLADRIGEPTGDLWVICCHPGRWEDFAHSSECRVHSVGEWEGESHISWHPSNTDGCVEVHIYGDAHCA